MNLMAISLIILLIPSISALDFNFSSPKDTKLNESFNVSLLFDNSESYDVKIFVHNSTDEKITRSEIISLIFSDKWQDSWLYILSSFPQIKSYNLKVIGSPGNREICVQLRKTGKSTYYKECKPIRVEEAILSKTLEENNNILSETSIKTQEEVFTLPPIELLTKQGKFRNILIISNILIVLLILILLFL